MANAENGKVNSPVSGVESVEEAYGYEGEIDLMGYFFIIWKHKWLILVCSVIPALVVGISIYLQPRSYKITHTYDVRSDASSWNLDQKSFIVLQSRFYSEDNLNRIIYELESSKHDKYAQKIKGFDADKSDEFVDFEALPPFVDLSKLNATEPDSFEKIRDMKAFLLNMTVTGKSLDELGKIALIIRDNFEKVTPLYMIQEQLSTEIRGYNSTLASIESSKYLLELNIKNTSERLAELKKIDVTTLDSQEREVVLQFDVGGQSQYLPLSYQIQAVESKLVDMQGQKKANTANYEYYEDLSILSARIIAELNDKLSSGQVYTIDIFRSFLADLISETEKQELKDHLASYIKKIENRISVSNPISANPKISPIAKGTVRKSGLMFMLALMAAVFVSLISEGLKNKQAQA